jgi:hypothetical protein
LYFNKEWRNDAGGSEHWVKQLNQNMPINIVVM